MKKVFPLIILLLLGTWAGTTWLISGQVEQNFDRALGQLNQKLKQDLPFFEVRAEDFDKGLFRSEASSKITLRDDSTGDDDALYLKHRIYHGPLMFTPMGVKLGSTYIVTTLDLDRLPGERREAIEKATGGKPLITVGMLTGTSKDFDLDVDVSPVEISADADDVTIRFDGMEGTVKSDFDGSYLKGELRNGRIAIDGNDEHRFEMAPATITFDIDQMYRGTVLSGTSSLSTPELALTGPGGIDIRGRNIRFTSNTRQNGGETTDAAVSLATDPITVDLPPKQIRLDAAAIAFDTRIEGMKTEQLKKLVDAGARLQNLDPEALKNGEAALDEELLDYLESIVGLLQPGLGSSTRFDFSTPKGKLDTELVLDYADARPAVELATLRDLLSALDGKLDIVADEALLAQLSLDRLAEIPVAMGFAVSENGKIRSQITIRNGVISINGAQTPFLDMLGPILDEPSPLRRLSAGSQQPV